MTEVNEFNRRNIEEFRSNHGRLGGPFEGAPVLLLHTTGARSGQERVHPLMYLADDGRYLLFASAAGVDRSPAWYWNLIAHPDASIEVGDEHACSFSNPVSHRDLLFSREPPRVVHRRI